MPLNPILGISYVLSGAVRSKEGSTAHARPHTAFKLLHNLCGNIIRNHSLGSTLSRQLSQVIILRIRMNVILIKSINELWEGRSNPYTNFILYTLNALF